MTDETTPLTPAEREEIRERCEEAVDGMSGPLAREDCSQPCRFILEDEVPDLLATIDQVEAERDEWQAACDEEAQKALNKDQQLVDIREALAAAGVAVDFGGLTEGVETLASERDALAAELARVREVAGEVVDHLDHYLKMIIDEYESDNYREAQQNRIARIAIWRKRLGLEGDS